MHYDGTPERKGGSGRVPNSKIDHHRIFPRVNVTIEPDLFDRLENFCAEEERARSWVIQKALEMYLSSKGY